MSPRVLQGYLLVGGQVEREAAKQDPVLRKLTLRSLKLWIQEEPIIGHPYWSIINKLLSFYD